jgi:hypothetical protein
MNKIVALLLLVSGSAYGSMHGPRPNQNLNRGSEIFIQNFIAEINALDHRLPQTTLLVTDLREIIRNAAPRLRKNYINFIDSIASKLRDTGTDFYTCRNACNKALQKLSNNEYNDLSEQQ